METSRSSSLPFVAAFIVVGAFYFWTAVSDGLSWHFGAEQRDHYNLLVHGFLEGKLSLKADVPPEILRLADPYDPANRPPGVTLHDASLFHGRYYIYYGVVPAVVLLLPFRIVTGTDLPLGAGVMLFVFGTYLLALVILAKIRARYFSRCGGGMTFLIAVAVGFASCAPILLRRHSMYELPISSAEFFGMAALLLLFRSVQNDGRSLGWLAASSVGWGLAIGSRPTYFFAPVALLAWAAWLSFRPANTENGQTGARRLKIFVAALGPLAAVGFGLATYNYLRFGNPAEFGVSYILSGVYESKIEHFSLRYVPWNIYAYWFSPAHWERYFPFIQEAQIAFARPAQHYGMDTAFGLWRHVPFLWLALAVPVAWRWQTDAGRRSELRWFVGALAWTFVSIAGFVIGFYAAMARYFGDFAPWLALLAAIAATALSHRIAAADRGWPRWTWRTGSGVVLAVSLAAITFFSIRVYDRLRQFNPPQYRVIARILNAPTRWLEHRGIGNTGPVILQITLPSDAPRGRQELAGTGWPPRRDAVYLTYPDSGHIVFEFEHAGAAVVRSEPVPTDKAANHTVEISMGSLFPPEIEPVFDQLTTEQRATLLRQIRVTFDRRVVLERKGQEFYEGGPGTLMIGSAGAERFSGRILHVDHGRITARTGE
jgi:hypothetical protein